MGIDRIRNAVLVTALAGPGLAACADTANGAESGKARVGNWGYDTSLIDASVKPGDDFFRYAGGQWFKTAQIPPDQSQWGPWVELVEQARIDVRAIIEDLAAGNGASGGNAQKIADFYRGYVDTDAIEKAGLAPTEPALDAIAAAKTHEDIARLMARVDLPVNSPIAMRIDLDEKNPDRYAVVVNQSGLGLPDRDYYLKTDESFVTIRKQYRDYIETMLKLSGAEDAAKTADGILALETEMAKLHWPIEKTRERDLTYNPKTRAELTDFAAGFPIAVALESSEIPTQDFFVVAESDAVQKLATLFADTPVAAWRDYLRFQYLNNEADVLPVAFDDARFDFFGRVINGQQEKRERWKRGVAAVSGALGEAIGQQYVKRHFSADSKAAMVELVENLRSVYGERIEQLSWMSPETKQAALRKLATFRLKVGFPDKWKDYSDMEIIAGDPLGNDMRALTWAWRYDARRLARKTDRDEWYMAPQIVNAYYNATFNEIVFPAAILQPPFFDLSADPAVNYGGIGAVIGHEMGHGFDDQGAKSDEFGVLRNWWQPQDVEHFSALGKGLADQYSQFEVAPGLKVNGQLTLGENIGDQAGVNVALAAWRMSLKGREAPILDGFSGEQRFFLGWAQIWRLLMRDELLRDRVLSDPHSPPEFRSIGPLRNNDAWYSAFDVKPGDRNYLPPQERVRIW